MRFWGQYGLQTALEVKYKIRFEIFGPNYICYHVCLGSFDLFGPNGRKEKKKDNSPLLELLGFAATKIFFQQIKSPYMPVQHLKGQPAASTYIWERGCLTFYSHRNLKEIERIERFILNCWAVSLREISLFVSVKQPWYAWHSLSFCWPGPMLPIFNVKCDLIVPFPLPSSVTILFPLPNCVIWHQGTVRRTLLSLYAMIRLLWDDHTLPMHCEMITPLSIRKWACWVEQQLYPKCCMRIDHMSILLLVA